MKQEKINNEMKPTTLGGLIKKTAFDKGITLNFKKGAISYGKK